MPLPMVSIVYNTKFKLTSGFCWSQAGPQSKCYNVLPFVEFNVFWDLSICSQVLQPSRPVFRLLTKGPSNTFPIFCFPPIVMTFLFFAPQMLMLCWMGQEPTLTDSLRSCRAGRICSDLSWVCTSGILYTCVGVFVSSPPLSLFSSHLSNLWLGSSLHHLSCGCVSHGLP